MFNLFLFIHLIFIYYQEDPIEIANLFFKGDQREGGRTGHFANTQFIIYVHMYIHHLQRRLIQLNERTVKHEQAASFLSTAFIHMIYVCS